MPQIRPRGRRIEKLLTIPALAPAPATRIEAIYPSSGVLPENLLKLYIHFSSPMRRGEVYQYIQLLDANGKPVDAPFLELAEELWDEPGQRLTLLLDPGRVKRDLKPHLEEGRALADGGRYTLRIRDAWRDARGTPLEREFEKTFRVMKADVHQPDPQKWQLTLPRAGTRQPLVINFNEPLDHALLEHAIGLSDSANQPIEGAITVDRRETRWSFQPSVPWRAGAHRLLVDATLEDLAGNSIGRPFEVYLPGGRPEQIDEYVLPFQIKTEAVTDSSNTGRGIR